MTINPYDSPQSDLMSEPALPRKPPGVWWKLYFFVTALLVFFDVFKDFHAGPVFYRNPWKVFMLTMFVLATIGLGGYVFRKKIVRVKFWRPFFYLYLLTLAINIGISIPKYIPTMSITPDVGFIALGVVIGTLLTLPTYIALYRYGSPNEFPWHEENT